MYEGLVEKAFVKTAMEREFVNMENKNIVVPTVTAVGCVSKINVKIFVRFVARLNLIIKWLNTNYYIFIPVIETKNKLNPLLKLLKQPD